MRILDRHILRELVAPWLFGVGLFSSLLLAATYLNAMAEFIADGVEMGLVLQLFALLVPAMLVKTFSMAVLLAALLGFGRLSSDSEIVALRAGGVSLPRIVVPVAVFSAGIALVTFVFNEAVVPMATSRSAQLREEILLSKKKRIDRAIAQSVVEKGELKAFLMAKGFAPANKTLNEVVMLAYGKGGQPTGWLFADMLTFSGSDVDVRKGDWKIRGNARLVSADGRTESTVAGGIWPEGIAEPNKPFSLVAAERSDAFDMLSMAQLRARIEAARDKQNELPGTIANWEYGYWNKIAVPLAAIVFGTLGAVLGIRNHRTGTAAGFALAVALIFGYMMLVNFMNVWAKQGVFPAWVASFAPLAIGSAAAGYFMWRRNQ